MAVGGRPSWLSSDVGRRNLAGSFARLLNLAGSSAMAFRAKNRIFDFILLAGSSARALAPKSGSLVLAGDSAAPSKCKHKQKQSKQTIQPFPHPTMAAKPWGNDKATAAGVSTFERYTLEECNRDVAH